MRSYNGNPIVLLLPDDRYDGTMMRIIIDLIIIRN